MQALTRLSLILLLLPLWALAGPDTSPRPRPLAFALEAASRGNWDAAARIAARDGAVAVDVIRWRALRAGEGTLIDYLEFIQRRPDWPGMALLRRKAEAKVKEAGPEALLIYFANAEPRTGAGKLAHADALIGAGKRAAGEAQLKAAWRDDPMSVEDQQAFLERHAALLRPLHEARVDMLLWERQTRLASDLLSLLSEDKRALAEARIALQRRSDDVEARLAAVPAALRNEPGLAHDRMEWRVRAGLWDGAKDMMLSRSTALGRAEAWANRRRALARDEMRDGDPGRAYRLASEHGLSGGASYADLEWLSGYIALRKLGDARRALVHFQNHRSVIASPISRGRAGYWIGRAHEALGDTAAATASYRDGAAFQTSFYGLLAAERAGLPFDPSLTAPATGSDWRTRAFAKDPLFEAGLLLQASGYINLAERFWVQLVDGLNAEDAASLGRLAIEAGQPHLAVMIAKRAARRGLTLPSPYYPLHPLGEADLPMDPAMNLAIARRESEFDPGVQSGAGARGLMQLMPGTGRDMARQMGVLADHSTERLTRDPVYNAQLGARYLSLMAGRFDGNPVLMAAAYNAGPARPERWMPLYGDPRRDGVDMIDWIEHIPFRETRNYVMRVTESLPIYRARLGRAPLPVPFTAELKGTSLLPFAPKGE